MSPTLIDASRMSERKPKKWISKAVPKSHEGRFAAKAKAAGKTTRSFAKEHEGDSGKTGAQARLAETLMGMHKPKHPGRSKLYPNTRA